MHEWRELIRAEFKELVEVLTSAAGRPRPEDFSYQEWNGIREQLSPHLVERAVDLSREELRLAWEAVDYVLSSLDRRCGEKDPHWINLRLTLMRELLKILPSSSEDDFLNPQFAIQLFFAEVDLAPEEAAALCENWRSRDLETVRKLHGIKIILFPTLEIWMRNFVGHDYDDELSRWAAVLPKLP